MGLCWVLVVALTKPEFCVLCFLDGRFLSWRPVGTQILFRIAGLSESLRGLLCTLPSTAFPPLSCSCPLPLGLAHTPRIRRTLWVRVGGPPSLPAFLWLKAAWVRMRVDLDLLFSITSPLLKCETSDCWVNLFELVLSPQNYDLLL